MHIVKHNRGIVKHSRGRAGVRVCAGGRAYYTKKILNKKIFFHFFLLYYTCAHRRARNCWNPRTIACAPGRVHQGVLLNIFPFGSLTW